jgi:Arc/MetJ family transcription regulator
MRAAISIDNKLLLKAMRATGLKTKQAVVEAGLHALIQDWGGDVGAHQDVSDAWSAEDLQDARRASLAAHNDGSSQREAH